MDSTMNVDYSLEAVMKDLRTNCTEPQIENVVRIEVDPSNVRCVKGDCCMDCECQCGGG